MLILRLTQTSIGEDKYQIEIALQGDGQARQTAVSTFQFKLTAEDQEDLRWYLEDYLQYPLDPAPTIARRIEKRMAEIGSGLFKSLFLKDDARDLWATLRSDLSKTRIEIATGVQEAASIPWELLRDPKTDIPLALRAQAFVRTYSQAVERPRLPQTKSGPIRILLVICRPGGSDDVPFRSVASRLIKGLGEREREAFQLEVLRPPTFEQLGKTLRQATNQGKPYHVVHFDGHGIYGDFSKKSALEEIMGKLSSLVLYGRDRKGPHGYLLFENPEIKENMLLVDGSDLGKLLVETNVPVLVLNACRSAHAETPDEPDKTISTKEVSGDVHSRVRALGSLAQEVMDTGVTGIVAMRYNVYVVTAAQFVADLYAALSQGSRLGEAVTLGRKQLKDQPLRTIAYAPIRLQDWCVPVVYEAAPIPLFPKPKKARKLGITLRAGDAAPGQEGLDPDLPKTPDAGFFGRDETLLALDRAFDTQPVVLLHAYAGSGKTATAAEFARWYKLTGGIRGGKVLFTSFEQYKPLARVLDQIERFFGPALEQSGVNWLASNDQRRRDIALQVLRQIPVLWIWDNVEPIAGFPAGTESAWSDAEQRELLDFLRDTRDTRAKFLLTSRRDELKWLGQLPRRITVPPMPMLERVQLTNALAEKQDRKLTDVEDWRPLLRFTLGNPLTVTVLVGQALRDGLKSKRQIEDFVERLRSGEARFADEQSEGRARSLGASLSYGFKHAFKEDERKILALLHFFQGFVDVDVLKAMGNPKADFCLPEVRGLTREAGISLLDGAAEVGLLTALGGGYYNIHPALPWYFKSLFDHYYRSTPRSESATRAFAETVGAIGDYYIREYESGNREVIAALKAEEANLLHARRLARQHDWWDPVTSAMQGLRCLYGHTGRRVEWARLVQEIVPDFIDPATDGPVPGREENWGLVSDYRVRIAVKARQWPEAERLQKIRVNWDRRRAARALQEAPKSLDDFQRNAIRTLAIALHTLGQIQRELENAECVSAYKESLEFTEKIGDQAVAAACALNLGTAYKNIGAIRSLDQAEQWYQRSLESRKEQDKLGRGKCLGQLGTVAKERFNEAGEAKRPEKELLKHLRDAERYYLQALDLIPSDAVDDLAVTHHQLGYIYDDAGDLNRALSHLRESIRLEENQGNIYGAAQTRYNVALLLMQAGRLEDALEYAREALRNYQTYGDRATDKVQETKQLIMRIEQAIQDQGKE